MVDDQVSDNLTVWALPSDVRAILARRAEQRNQSLYSYVVDVLSRDAETPTMAEMLAEVDDVRGPTKLTSDDAVAAVRAVRDAADAVTRAGDRRREARVVDGRSSAAGSAPM